ncbi:hypothetical protein Desdi_0714 [Desulfitobacterium dichloroeliminans LMG P-21439]|uniref:SurA-like protein n=1 Tax=Desulfitobacterium dichloroeliminans (strain LMG P-21439 / DCA1) TaxID=871963 RepID=L0F6F5_DESDL|nr:hypothetical protein [Desulfitobacterium dichloroeliminans]AGA68241.1 hypothetical protein Desdi_0714 [Desulfitobacterium dichloroeliminans LMG P-21439]
MKVKMITVIVLILALSGLVGCAEKKYPEDAVALVNGVIINEQEIEKEIAERKMVIAIGEKIRSLEANSLTPKEALIQSLNITEDEFNSEQIRYIESTERATSKLLSSNEAFNILLREEIYYQEAVKQGYEVSVDEAKQILVESNKVSNEVLNDDEEVLRKQNEITKSITDIYKQYGFESEEDYLNQRIDKSAQAMTISRMKGQFSKVITDKLPDSDGVQLSMDISNSWDDYGEFLLDKSKVKVLNTKYSTELYGKPWGYGLLDLK